MTKIKRFPFILFLCILFFNNGILANTTDVCPEEEPTVIELVRMCNFFTAEAFVPSTGNTGCTSSNTLVLYAGDNCSSEVKMNIYAANLHSSPTYGQTYDLPTGMPPIYVEYDSDFDALYDELSNPISSFIYKGLIVEDHMGGHVPLFERELTLVNVSDDLELCSSTGNPFPEIFPVRLIESEGVMYPVHDYASPTDVFSCYVFHETCGDCDNVPGTPTTTLTGCSSSEPEYFTDICLDCNRCDNRSEKFRDKEEEHTLVTQDLSEVKFFQKAQPNPFSDEITLQYELTTATEVQFSITDMQGKRLHTITDFSNAGVQMRTLNLAELPLGVYYCTLRTDHLVETLRIVKSK